MIKAIAVDDEPPALSLIENFCSRIDFIQFDKAFSKPNEALKYLRKFPVDLLFLDIQMPSLNGIEFYKSLEKDTMTIFTTAYSEYAVEGFNLNAVDYLLKPFTFERFKQAVEKARDLYDSSRHQKINGDEVLYIRADYSLVKINIAEILLIEGLDDYLKIYRDNARPLVVRMTMKAMMEKLPIDFIRVHRSFIVPLSRIQSVRNKVISVAEREIPVGSSYETAFAERFGK